MAILDKKKMAEIYKHNTVPSSARMLLQSLADCSDRTGSGTPSWTGLMYMSGIKGKDTFSKAREILKELGLIEFIKEWKIIDEKGKKLPRATILYQISENILWKNSPTNQAKFTNITTPQSMTTESMHLRKEDVASLGVNNIGVYNNQPLAVNKPIKKEITTKRGGNPTSIGENPGGSLASLMGSSVADARTDIKYEWQFEAERIAEYLKIPEPSSSWFKFFRDSFLMNRKFLLQDAASRMVDIDGVNDKELYFFKLAHSLLEKG